MPLHSRNGIPCGNGNDERTGSRHRGDFRQYFIEHLRLDRQQHRIGPGRCFMVPYGGRDTVRFLNSRQPFDADIGSQNLGRMKMPPMKQAGDDRFRHIPRADTSDPPILQHPAIIPIVFTALQLASATGVG